MGPKPSEGSEVAHKLKNTGLDHNFLGDSKVQGSLVCCSPWSGRVGHD